MGDETGRTETAQTTAEKKNNKRAQPLRLNDVPRYTDLVVAVKRAFRAAKKGKYPLKHVALAAVLTFTGCRLGEALDMTTESLRAEERVVYINQKKKGGEFVRVVPVPSDLFWAVMREYLKGIISGEKLFNITERGARWIIYEFTERYLGRRYRPHSFRHAYALFIIKKTRDLEAVRRLLGHASYKWLRVYLDYTQEDLEDYLAEAFMGLGV